MADESAIPFHTYLWKIASRCNLNCSYCYIYNSVDDRWRRQPNLMSVEVALQAARRMREHLDSHGKKDASIIFHGGEPLFGGIEHILAIMGAIGRVFGDGGIKLTLGMQSNLLLFNPQLGDVLDTLGFSIGVSMDGPPRVNDRFRINHAGRASSAQLEERLALITTERYRRLFAGFLCVIDIDADPVEVTDYLLSYRPPSIDFLFPLDNHDRLPRGKRTLDDAPYGDWLIRSFDRWIDVDNETSIRIFRSIMRMICGVPTLVESLGLLPVDIIVVETNGEVEGVDSLKATFPAATQLGYDVFRNSFDDVAKNVAVRNRQIGLEGLAPVCRSCGVVHVCGGGYLPHRYSKARGFLNPSVYCRDLENLIRHIHARMRQQLAAVSPSVTPWPPR